jgi:nitroreductase
MLTTAAAAVLICGDSRLEPDPIYQIQNCSAATQNLLLAAHDSGLGAVWLGIQPRGDRIRTMVELFDLPEQLVPISLVALGYPDGQPNNLLRKLDGKVHYERWKR